jgi:sugar fermentation stimulation protein A
MMTKTPYTFNWPLEEGVIRKRKTQFTMIVVVNGRDVSCHCPATERIGDIDLAALPCLLSQSAVPARKTPYTVEAVSVNRPCDTRKSWIGINQPTPPQSG